MNIHNHIIEHFPTLHEMKCQTLAFDLKSKVTLASVVAKANLPYMPGIYFVYDNTSNRLGNLLYVGVAGADKQGNINTHQLPKRLLAVCYPPEKYLKNNNKKHLSRNKIWPKMMEIDQITGIKIFCYFSEINDDYKVLNTQIPLVLEKNILKYLKENSCSLAWSKRNNL